MKKILLLGVLLFMAAPAMADPNVTISCEVDDNEVTVSYAATGDPCRVRAFGLDITITSGDANITKMEMVSTDYRIFPGQIEIDNGEVTDWGTPYAADDLGDANLTVEMGSLYADDDPCEQDPPPTSGQLFKFWVTCGSEESHFAITENMVRGGVVMEDPDEDPNVILCDANICEITDLDWGDAPDTYPTLLASNGPSHVPAGPMLGAVRDVEPDGQPSPWCDLDDNTGVPDDEDGVTLIIAKDPNGSATVTVSAACMLDAWMDFNGDGDFNDAGEQIFASQALVAGANLLIFPVPAVNKQSTIVSRWRVSTAGGLSYDGPADDGEVEDYITECLDLADPGYAAWISATWNRPRCWCFRRQCRGDINGAKAGPFWVQVTDLNVFKQAFNKNDTQLAAVPNGICADLNHLKAGPFRVNVADLNIFKQYFNKPATQVPPCDSAPIITGPYNFWTNSPN